METTTHPLLFLSPASSSSTAAAAAAAPFHYSYSTTHVPNYPHTFPGNPAGTESGGTAAASGFLGLTNNKIMSFHHTDDHHHHQGAAGVKELISTATDDSPAGSENINDFKGIFETEKRD
ncbi:hypothetical protein H6P81_012071 [Aristolochia fimbriata]|uniref:Uncharacterized protein n=1 Tax=Aristolochia fimbriata TaxID=158543 RepID=A0AAV7EAW5_ARIFI|nr:hypothetical protein H6P81_012071 [Aristolochia fimbriata]